MRAAPLRFLALAAITIFFACEGPFIDQRGRCIDTCLPYGINAQPLGSLCVEGWCECPSGTKSCCTIGNPGRCQAEECQDPCPNDQQEALRPCETEAYCIKPVSPRCGRAVCMGGACALELVRPLPQQRYGDCKRLDCDVRGEVIEFDDASDFFDDALPCTVDFCKNGPTHLALSDGSPCSSDSGPGYCYQGQCVECVAALPGAACPSGEVCDGRWCEPSAQCSGGACGGACAPCGPGLSCTNHADCVSDSCVGFVCQSPSCSDTRKNGGESDVDCGGPSCGPCSDGKECHAHADCLSQVCFNGVCQAPTCLDGVKNGEESGTDCGEACEAPCL